MCVNDADDKNISKDKIIDVLERECFDLVAKCISLINLISWDEDHTFTFPDGDKWTEFNPEGD